VLSDIESTFVIKLDTKGRKNIASTFIASKKLKEV